MPHRCSIVILCNVVGQSHMALTRIMVIGCKQNHTNSNLFVDLVTKKYWLQVLFDCRSFNTSWYWVISINTFNSIPTNTQPYGPLHSKYSFTRCLWQEEVKYFRNGISITSIGHLVKHFGQILLK